MKEGKKELPLIDSSVSFDIFWSKVKPDSSAQCNTFIGSYLIAQCNTFIVSLLILMEWSDQGTDHSSHQQGDVVLSVLQDEDEGSVHNDLLLPGEGGAEEDQLDSRGRGPLCPLLGHLNHGVVKDAADAWAGETGC